jgi:hypothetical protein
MSFLIDTRDLSDTIANLQGYGDAVKRAEFRSVNKVADKTRTAAKRQITSSVNLSSSYIDEHLVVAQRAQLAAPVAVITGKFRPTKLSTYGAKQLLVADPKSRGNPGAGIPAGQRGVGVEVGVKRGGARKVMKSAFMLRLLFDNGQGVFTRENGKLKHHYGPSVDQGFRLYLADHEKEIADDLEVQFTSQFEYELGGLK